jgi:hypothetical protein
VSCRYVITLSTYDHTGRARSVAAAGTIDDDDASAAMPMSAAARRAQGELSDCCVRVCV